MWKYVRFLGSWYNMYVTGTVCRYPKQPDAQLLIYINFVHNQNSLA